MPRFTTGNSGRPKGAQNKATREIQQFSRDVLERPTYVQSLKKRIDEGKAPHMETLLAHYAYGKPKDILALESLPPLMVVDELTAEDVALQRAERES